MILTLYVQTIKEAVKSDTYITGQIDKSSDMVKNAALAYNEQAGNDAYHENKLYRTMRAAVAKFEAHMAEYVDVSSNVVVSDTLTPQSTTSFTITIPTGTRFYGAFSNVIANLAHEYIINMMLYTWWQSIKPSLAKDYYDFAQESIASVRRCLAKTPPVSAGAYTDVTGTADNGGTGSSGSSGNGGTGSSESNNPINRTFRTYYTQNSITIGEEGSQEEGSEYRTYQNSFLIPLSSIRRDAQNASSIVLSMQTNAPGSMQTNVQESSALADLILLSDDYASYDEGDFNNPPQSMPRALSSSEIRDIVDSQDYEYLLVYVRDSTSSSVLTVTYTY